MTRRRARWDARAVALGAGIALAIGVPTALVSQALDATDRIDDDSGVVYVAAAIIVVGLGIGGAVAATRQPSAPLRHGAAAALVAYVIVAAIGLARRAVDGDDLRWAVVAINAVVAMWAGLLGAVISEARVTFGRRSRRSPS